MKKALWSLFLGLLVIIAVGGCATSTSSDTTTTTTVATTTSTVATTTTETSTSTTTTATTTSTLAGYSVTGNVLIGECTYETALIFLTPTSELCPIASYYGTFESGAFNFNLETLEAGVYMLWAIAPIPVDEFEPIYVAAIGLTTGEESALMAALRAHVITFEGAYRTENAGNLPMYRLISAPSGGNISGTIMWSDSSGGCVALGRWNNAFSGSPNVMTWEVIPASTTSWNYRIENLEDGDYYLVAAFYPGRSTPRSESTLSILSNDQGGCYSDGRIPPGIVPGYTGVPEAITISGADANNIDFELKDTR